MNEQVQQIYDLYVENNLINPDNVDVEMFANANPEQLTQLYELGVDNELFRDTDQDTFMSAFNTMEVKKKALSTLLRVRKIWNQMGKLFLRNYRHPLMTK